jgi:uncharacterized protein YbjQ (UPF0145 family)
MADENTDKAGSAPESKEEIKPDEQAAASSTANKDVKDEKPSDSEVPWHKDPRFKNDLGLLKAAKSLMEANDLEDVEDLKALLESGKKVHGKKIDLDKLDEIAGKAATLDQYQKYWDQQKEYKRELEETPEQTIARLKQERDAAAHKVTAKEQAERESLAARQAVDFYEGEVKTNLELMDDITPAEKEFVSWALGVGNDCNEITITDRKQVKRVVTSGVKKYQKLVEQIREEAIKEYRAGKTGIPAVPSSTGAVPATKPDPPKGLKGLRSAFLEAVQRKE